MPNFRNGRLSEDIKREMDIEIITVCEKFRSFFKTGKISGHNVSLLYVQTE